MRSGTAAPPQPAPSLADALATAPDAVEQLDDVARAHYRRRVFGRRSRAGGCGTSCAKPRARRRPPRRFATPIAPRSASCRPNRSARPTSCSATRSPKRSRWRSWRASIGAFGVEQLRRRVWRQRLGARCRSPMRTAFGEEWIRAYAAADAALGTVPWFVAPGPGPRATEICAFAMSTASSVKMCDHAYSRGSRHSSSSSAPPAPRNHRRRRCRRFKQRSTCKDLMNNVLDPAADGIWESVGTIITMEGTFEKAPANDDEWAGVKAQRDAARRIGQPADAAVALRRQSPSGSSMSLALIEQSNRAHQGRRGQGQGRAVHHRRRHLRRLHELPQAVRPGDRLGQVAVSLLAFCEWLAATEGSTALRESLFMYPLVESTHVLFLLLFVGPDGGVGPAAARPRLHAASRCRR